MERIAEPKPLLPNVQASSEPPAPAKTLVRQAATGAILAAVLLGMLGDWLFRAPGPGINLVLWVVAAIGATAWVARLRGRAITSDQWALALAVVFFAGVFAWRDAEGLLVLNMLAMLSGFGLLALALAGWPASVFRASVTSEVCTSSQCASR